jgi:hypothetical protein
MRKRRISKSPCLWLIASVCFALFSCTVPAGPTWKKPQDSTQTTKSDTIEYRVGRRASITENSKVVLVVLVSIDSKHFVRDDMLKLAQQLKQDFESEPRVRVDIFDDHSAASVWDPVHFYGPFQAAHRGTYYRDVKPAKEYIEFSIARGKRKKRITLGK